MKLYRDNKAAINIFNNSALYDRTKHVEIDRHFIRKNIVFKDLILLHIKSQDQIADVFTKGLSSNDFGKDICKLDMFDVQIQLEGEC